MQIFQANCEKGYYDVISFQADVMNCKNFRHLDLGSAILDFNIFLKNDKINVSFQFHSIFLMSGVLALSCHEIKSS